MDFDIESRTILLVRHGSHAYGTNIEGSDVDVKGVCIPPTPYIMGCFRTFDQHESKVPHDSVVFALRKFAKLAGDNNPNIIEVLFGDDTDVLKMDKFGQRLRESRDIFLSRKAKHTFSGYAHSQLQRIRTHRSWLLKPPAVHPDRAAFGLPPERTVSKSEMGAFLEAEEKGWVEDDGVDDIVPMTTTPDELRKRGEKVITVEASVIRLLQKEKAYGRAKREWEQYQNWLKSRNPVRSALEAKYGYDTKHASHLVRLMRMCKEILATGVVIVKRPDADELRSIRAGAWDYDRLIAYAEELDAECTEIEKTSPLPRSPNWHAIDDLVIGLTQDYLSANP